VREIVYVPTMGNLHEASQSDAPGARARQLRGGEHLRESLQFGPNEDFDQYPRTWMMIARS